MQAMNYLKVQNEPNILPVREKKMPHADPNINFGKALLCSYDSWECILHCIQHKMCKTNSLMMMDTTSWEIFQTHLHISVKAQAVFSAFSF